MSENMELVGVAVETDTDQLLQSRIDLLLTEQFRATISQLISIYLENQLFT